MSKFASRSTQMLPSPTRKTSKPVQFKSNLFRSHFKFKIEINWTLIIIFGLGPISFPFLLSCPYTSSPLEYRIPISHETMSGLLLNQNIWKVNIWRTFFSQRYSIILELPTTNLLFQSSVCPQWLIYKSPIKLKCSYTVLNCFSHKVAIWPHFAGAAAGIGHPPSQSLVRRD